jgi:Tfp pilus assembly protein PilF
MQIGDLDAAEQAHKDAMRLGPDYFYVRYSLGQLYQRANRSDEARKLYLEASLLAPGRAEPLNGLGSLELMHNRPTKAERLFREALTKPDQLPSATLTARHNLALVLERRRTTAPEALQMFQANGAYLPSRLELAAWYVKDARKKQWKDADANQAAIEAYEGVLYLAPDHIAARKDFAAVLESSKQPELAVVEYDRVLALTPADGAALERKIELLTALNRRAEACRAIESASGKPGTPARDNPRRNKASRSKWDKWEQACSSETRQ